MRLLIAFLCLLPVAALSAPTHVIFSSKQCMGVVLEGVKVVYQPLSVTTSGGFIVPMIPVTNTLDSDGVFTNGFFANSYRVMVLAGPLYTQFTNCIPETNAIISAADYICSTLSTAAGTAYSSSASDRRYVLKSAGTATNITIISTATPSPTPGQVFTYTTGGVGAWSNAVASATSGDILDDDTGDDILDGH
jgi:hypothetical protein